MSAATIDNISLYIPHIFGNFTKEFVAQVFNDQNIGKVKTVDFVHKMGKDGKAYNSAYIHFEEWYNTIATRNFQSNVRDTNKEARLMYEEPWYWIVLENKARKHIPGERKPCIVIDEPAKSTIHEQTKTALKEEIQWKQVIKKVNLPKKFEAPLPKPKPVNLATHFAAEPAFPETPQPVVAQINEKAAREELVEFALQNDPTEEEIAWANAIMEEEEAQLDDVEDAIDEDEAAEEEAANINNQYLVSIDGRYVQTLEQEHEMYKQQCDYYYAELCKLMELYKTEAIKTQALAEAIQLIKK